MPATLLESLEADALVTVIEHTAVGAELVTIVLIRSCSWYLTRTQRNALSTNSRLYNKNDERLF
jgi:hypothetical protein